MTLTRQERIGRALETRLRLGNLDFEVTRCTLRGITHLHYNGEYTQPGLGSWVCPAALCGYVPRGYAEKETHLPAILERGIEWCSACLAKWDDPKHDGAADV